MPSQMSWRDSSGPTYGITHSHTNLLVEVVGNSFIFFFVLSILLAYRCVSLRFAKAMDVLHENTGSIFSSHWDSLVNNQAADAKESSATSENMQVLLDELWARYDADRSGTLDEDELFLLCVDYVHAIPEIQALKARYDTRVWAQVLKDTAAIISNNVLGSIDDNGDGVIDREEFRSSFWQILGHQTSALASTPQTARRTS